MSAFSILNVNPADQILNVKCDLLLRTDRLAPFSKYAVCHCITNKYKYPSLPWC